MLREIFFIFSTARTNPKVNRKQVRQNIVGDCVTRETNRHRCTQKALSIQGLHMVIRGPVHYNVMPSPHLASVMKINASRVRTHDCWLVA
jgi:hypothetical protein